MRIGSILPKIGVLSLSLSLSLGWSSAAWAIDATKANFDDLTVISKGAGGVPVGSVIAWPVSSNPEDMENWLECNGQAVNPDIYPELYAIVGSTVPDYRGLFLRGHGQVNTAHYDEVTHSSEELNTLQGDSIRALPPGKSGVVTLNHSHGGGPTIIDSGGGLAWYSSPINHSTSSGSWNYWTVNSVSINVGAVINNMPTSNEIRPVNKAVRYLIRATQ